MCGIAGFVNGDGRAADLELVRRMTATIAHRGPDGEGHYRDGPLALGHRRLAILDVEGGVQPLSNEDRTVWVSYNGEIYNEPVLRTRLQGLGHRYATGCDTESLVHLYEEDGPDFVDALNGMFAFALWDTRRGRLILGRDRMGQKPLYYAELPGGGLVFGSEPKAILAHPEIGRRIDPDSLARYLFYEYLPDPYSIWSGLRQLPPGHRLIWENGRFRVDRFWKSGVPGSDDPPPFEVEKDRFWGRFRDSVARHRRSDVPLGVFLSGGVDSSSVAAALCELGPASEVKTFAIGFEDPSFDESRYAREVARSLGTDHHERTFSAGSLIDLLPEVAGWLDEPFGDASVLPTFLLSRFARESVTVALGGDGADEILAGYPTFRASGASKWYGRMPAPAKKLAGAMAGVIPVDHRNFSLDFRVKQFLRGAGESPPLAHQRWLGSFSGAEIAGLLVDWPRIDVEAEHLERAAQLAPGSDDLTRMLLLYQDTYLPGDILRKVDRASMATSLEVRAPWLDADLVDSIARLPADYKLGRGVSKRLLKASAATKLPQSVLNRPKKGFGIPVARWLRGPLTGLLDTQLGPDRLRRQGIFRPEPVARLIHEHREGRRDHRKPLWTLLMFQNWHDRWLAST